MHDGSTYAMVYVCVCKKSKDNLGESVLPPFLGIELSSANEDTSCKSLMTYLAGP